MKRELNSVVGQIQMKIQEIPLGEPFTPSALSHLGTRANIHQVLSRMTKAGQIDRITHGVYVKPRTSKYVQKVSPGAEKIAQAVVAGSNQVMSISGAEAARRFGLSTQMSTQYVFLTSGSSRVLTIRNMVIQLRHTSARWLTLAGHPAGEALVALRYLGRELVTTQTIAKIEKGLTPEEFELLKSPSCMPPAWLNDVIYKYEREKELALNA